MANNRFAQSAGRKVNMSLSNKNLLFLYQDMPILFREANRIIQDIQKLQVEFHPDGDKSKLVVFLPSGLFVNAKDNMANRSSVKKRFTVLAPLGIFTAIVWNETIPVDHARIIAAVVTAAQNGQNYNLGACKSSCFIVDLPLFKEAYDLLLAAYDTPKTLHVLDATPLSGQKMVELHEISTGLRRIADYIDQFTNNQEEKLTVKLAEITAIQEEVHATLSEIKETKHTNATEISKFFSKKGS